jgi:putative tryptophan/tyrosine transport system substrate-binding protein
MNFRSVLLVGLMTVGLLGGPFLAEAQPPKRIPRIAILSNARAGGPWVAIDGLRQGLRDLGYIEGQNIIIEYRFTERRYERFPQLVAELVSLNPDVIVTSTTAGVLAAKRATTSIPIVVGSAGDLAERGIVASLARPGGNITGMTFHSKLERLSKQLGTLKEAVPKISYVAFLVHRRRGDREKAFRDLDRDLEPVSRALGIRIQRIEARGVDEFEAAFSVMAKSGVDALLMENDSVLNQNRKRITQLAAKGGLPSVAQRPAFAEAGGLMSYGTSIQDMWRRAATHVDKILKGAKPGDLPMERPRKFNLVVNLNTAKKLGITIPSSILYEMEADHDYEVYNHRTCRSPDPRTVCWTVARRSAAGGEGVPDRLSIVLPGQTAQTSSCFYARAEGVGICGG